MNEDRAVALSPTEATGGSSLDGGRRQRGSLLLLYSGSAGRTGPLGRRPRRNLARCPLRRAIPIILFVGVIGFGHELIVLPFSSVPHVRARPALRAVVGAAGRVGQGSPQGGARSACS